MSSKIPISEEVIQWIKSIDRPGTRLAVFDSDKYTECSACHECIKAMVENSCHVKFRFGGNGFRLAEDELYKMLDGEWNDFSRFELFVGPGDIVGLPGDFDFAGKGIVCCDMAKLGIQPESDFGRYIDHYDIRGSQAGYSMERGVVTVYDRDMMQCRGADTVCFIAHSRIPSETDDDAALPSLSDGTLVVRNDRGNGLTGAMSTLFLRGELSGVIQGGKFEPFNRSEKGRWAIGDVVMVKGFGDIPPATHVLAPTDMLAFAQARRRMFAEAGLPVQYVSGFDRRTWRDGVRLARESEVLEG